MPAPKTAPHRLRTLSCFALVLFLAFVGCRGKCDELRLEEKNFKSEISQEQNLVFTFDKDLVTDSLLNQWDTIPYLRFTPRVEGKFKWTAPNELVFSPAQAFAPSTSYQAELTPDLLRHSATPYKIPAGQDFKFHTPYLKLNSAKAYWTQNENNPTQLVANVQFAFNYPVPFAVLRDKLKVYQGTTELPIELGNGTRDQVAIRVKGLDLANPNPMPVRVHLAKGLSTPGSTYQTPEATQQTVLLPGRGKMQVLEVVTAQAEGQDKIYVLTSQPVVNPDVNALVTLTPRREYTVERLENGLVLSGDFASGQSYRLAVSGELSGVEGEPLGKAFEYPVSFSSGKPTVAFVHQKSIYLSSQGARNLALDLTKVPRVKVSISKVFENNILRYLQEGQTYDGYYDEQTEEYYENAYYAVNETNGKTIFEREYEAASLPRQGKHHLLHLNLPDLDFDSNFKGLYVITVSSTENNWLKDSKIISVSDIGLIAKQGKDEVLVFANSIRTAQTLPGVEVRFISTNNQVVHKTTTNQDGVARFPNMDKTAAGFKMGLITARQGDDFNYLPYAQTQVNTSRFDVGGKRLDQLPYDAFLYGDRDLYRPGDTVHVNTLVRTPAWKTVAGLPIKLKLLLPNGKEYRSQKGTLNQEGAYETAFVLSPSVVTGTYTLEAYSGNDVLLNARKIGVEEFMPDRLKVTAVLNKTDFVPGQHVQVNLTAQNLFGPPAAGRTYEVQLSLKKKPFEAKQYPDFHFELNQSGDALLQNSVRQGQTDAQGKGQETFALDELRDVGQLEGSLFTTVFDETGRPVNRLNRFTVNTQPIFYGLKKFDPYVSTRQPLRVPLLALDARGRPAPAQVQVQVVRYTYETVVERYSQNYNYKSQRRSSVLLNTVLQTDQTGRVDVQFLPSSSGEYELRVMRPGAHHYVAREFYAYGWGDTQSTSFEVNTEGEVDIALDKESYEVGETARVLFKSPFAGKILVTVEQNKVLSYHYLKTDKKAASLQLPILDEHLPTAYISAVALREVKDSQLPLTIARGFKPVHVTRKDTWLEVAITAPESSRSNRTQPIRIKTAPNAEVTLAVVDEGILQLKDYQTPDPHGFFYQKRALEVQAFDLYPFLFPELTGTRSSTGGDGYDLEKRINPLTSKRVKLVALWSGRLKTNGSGEALVQVKLPEFSGAVRIMAVAYKANAFGSAEKRMRVADPMVISAALPRFLSPKDTVYVPVTLSNTTAKNAPFSSSISVTGPLRVVGSAMVSATAGANSERQVQYKLVATPAIGQATVKVAVKALGEQFTNTTQLTVRPAAPLAQTTQSGTLKNAATVQLPAAQDYLPTSVSSRLVVSTSPLVQFTDDISFLLQYPHGCLEQTTSTAFPLLYYADLARALHQEQKGRTFNPAYLVQEAITKIEGMQQYDGGFTYWPGATHTDWWSSAYATHFLLEARKAGYPVSREVLDRALSYLQRMVKGKATEVYRFYDAARRVQSKYVAAHESAYSLYVLSVADQPDWSTMNYYKAKPDLLSLDSRYLLASTYALNGGLESFRQLLPRSFAGETSVRALDGSFYSPLRDRAISLNSLVEANPDHPQVATLARHLSQELRSARWYNTQERAFALLALGKLASRSGGNLSAQVLQGGKVVGAFTGKDLRLTHQLKNAPVTLRSKGQGTLYYFWETEGISQSGHYRQEDHLLQVRKKFFDRNGKEITHHTVRQNDLVVVRLALQSLDGRTIPNVAITDLLPAGFEVENPRLMTSREFGWLQAMAPATPDHLDMRDDRINLYATARPKPQYFFYQVRAVSKGDFQMGPVGADAMYNAEYHSYHGAGVMKVR
ncbi:alpha-2-macroglobulin family protein [Rufibacter psychrotolerans]|uniref:alpha-2-macroglobulin family protein n=1 Tax=Rufibacter psychrotolerans TaxID=2812556 RepID=UPI001967308B|nr:MG2 domain-containing protein [Rufibacter sp. SYSU D00308]